jgi:hypothetical protein
MDGADLGMSLPLALSQKPTANSITFHAQFLVFISSFIIFLPQFRSL